MRQHISCTLTYFHRQLRKGVMQRAWTYADSVGRKAEQKIRKRRPEDHFDRFAVQQETSGIDPLPTLENRRQLLFAGGPR
jgi:hypothetical protein